jgi:hypothetical protein
MKFYSFRTRESKYVVRWDFSSNFSHLVAQKFSPFAKYILHLILLRTFFGAPGLVIKNLISFLFFSLKKQCSIVISVTN